MARGLFTITSVANLGGSPTQYQLTVSSTATILANDHVGARLSGDISAIYNVLSVDSATLLTVNDLLTEAETGEFGAPAVGAAGFGTPEPNNDLTQLPFDSPGWDAMHRRNMFIIDNIPSGSGGGETLAQTLTLGSSTGGTNLTVSTGDRVNIGGATVTFPAVRYGGSAGVVDLLRADGTNGAVTLNGTAGLTLDSSSGTVNLQTSASTRWSVNNTALLPGTDSTYNIGTPTNRVLNSYADAAMFGALVSAKTINYVVLNPDDVGTWFTNEGAGAQVTFNLPTAIVGLRYTFYVQAAVGIILQAATGDTIRLSALVSTVAGTASSTTVGSLVRLVSINSTEWIAEFVTGTWATA